MMEIVEKLKKGLKNYNLDELKIGLIYLFGSYAEGTQTPLSDIDIGIVFTDKKILQNSFDLYAKIYDILTDILPEYQDKVDIVFLQKAPLNIQSAAVTEGILIYEKDFDFRVKYEDRVILLFADFQPILKIFDKAILERIK